MKHINLQKSLTEDLIYKRVEKLTDKISNLLWVRGEPTELSYQYPP